MKYYRGIDLGGTNIAAGIVDENYNMVYKHSERTIPQKSFGEIVADVAGTAKTAVKGSGLPMDEMVSIGLGTPSCINPKTGLLVNANNLGWRNVPLYQELRKHFDKPLFIKNDADCAALGEILH